MTYGIESAEYQTSYQCVLVLYLWTGSWTVNSSTLLTVDSATHEDAP